MSLRSFCLTKIATVLSMAKVYNSVSGRGRKGGGGAGMGGKQRSYFFHSECVLQLLCFATRGPKSEDRSPDPYDS